MRRLIAATAVLILGIGAGAVAWFYLAPPDQVLRTLLTAQRASAGLEVKTVTADGLELAYLEGGSGEPLVLLHGLGGSKDNWNRVAPELTDAYRVIAPDLPGFGDSPRPEGRRYGTDDQVNTILAFMDALDLDEVSLGGNSMGGLFAASLAGRAPERVTRLWLLAPGGVGAAEASDLERVMRARGAGEPSPLLLGDEERFDDWMRWLVADPPPVPGPIRQAWVQRAAADMELHRRILATLVAEWQTEPLETRVRGSDVPTRIVWGEQDRVLHVSGADVLAQAMNRASVLRLEDVGHLPMIEAPDRVAADWLEYADP